jgi:hypothetical protein
MAEELMGDAVWASECVCSHVWRRSAAASQVRPGDWLAGQIEFWR